MKIVTILAVGLAYLLGSLPTGVWLSRRLSGEDIREIGDGNSGARNVTHMLGWKAGIAVGLVDFSKGALAVFIAQKLDLTSGWQLAAGISAVFGHDFPLFARFRGGQGMATSLGTMGILFPNETLFGLLLFGLIYLITRNFDPSAAAGLGTLVFLLWRNRWPNFFLIYAVALFLSIPLKKFLDYRFRYIKNIHPI